MFISSGNRGRVFVTTLGPCPQSSGQDAPCPPGRPPDAPTNYGDTMGQTGITINSDSLYSLYPEAEGEVLGIRICLFGATLQSARDVSQLLTIYRVSGMGSEQLAQYPIDILPATGNAYFNLAPIESPLREGQSLSVAPTVHRPDTQRLELPVHLRARRPRRPPRRPMMVRCSSPT